MNADRALEILATGEALVDCELTEPLSLRKLATAETVLAPITIRRGTLLGIDSSFCEFHRRVVLEDVRIEGRADFYAAYFLAGFTAVRCRFEGELWFQCGGHNSGGTEFVLEDCQVTGFAYFDDCWYEGPFTIRGCQFVAGSNLLSFIGQPTQVQFDVTPVLEGNDGELDVERSG